MSGGSYNYLFTRNNIEDLTDEDKEHLKDAKKILEENDHKSSAFRVGQIIQSMETIQTNMEKLGGILKEVEWYRSGDIGEETMNERIKEKEPSNWKEIQKYIGILANENESEYERTVNALLMEAMVDHDEDNLRVANQGNKVWIEDLDGNPVTEKHEVKYKTIDGK